MLVRTYKSDDYEQIVKLYKDCSLYGGQFDENRDAKEILNRKILLDPDSILLCEYQDEIIGTVSLIEDGRIAWLFRFAVASNPLEKQAAQLLYNTAIMILKNRGHKQVLVYSAAGNEPVKNRYLDLGMNVGGSYVCYWSDLE